MNSTEDILYDEKKKIYDLSSNNKIGYVFPVIDNNVASYYIPYAKSKHLDSVLSTYGSEELSEFKTNLSELWMENYLDVYKRIIVACYFKTMDVNKKLVEDVDLYNYMI